VYVADAQAGTIVRLSSDGKPLSVWPFPGFIPGQYTYPTGYPFGVAVDGDHGVYLTDTYRNRILKLSPSGQLQATWGGPGSDPGEFDVPLGIAVDGRGHIYVGDRNNHRVQKFSATGVPLPAWGASPPPASRFDVPRALATDRSANVYVLTGRSTPRVQELSPQGLPLREVVLRSLHQGDFLSGLAVDDAGNIYVADAVRNRVDVFWPTGKLRAAWGTAGIGGGQFHDPTDVVVDRRGPVYVADSDNQRVQIFSPPGRLVRDWYAAGYPQSVAVDGRGRVYLADPVRHDVEEHSASGRLVRVLGHGAPGGLELKKPVAVAVDHAGNLYVADAGIGRVVEVSATGRIPARWGPFVYLEDVAVDPDGAVYALDGGTRHVVRLSPSAR
jgi:DNA-binding beta-propeller fold protein YncE